MFLYGWNRKNAGFWSCVVSVVVRLQVIYCVDRKFFLSCFVLELILRRPKTKNSHFHQIKLTPSHHGWYLNNKKNIYNNKKTQTFITVYHGYCELIVGKVIFHLFSESIKELFDLSQLYVMMEYTIMQNSATEYWLLYLGFMCVPKEFFDCKLMQLYVIVLKGHSCFSKMISMFYFYHNTCKRSKTTTSHLR